MKEAATAASAEHEEEPCEIHSMRMQQMSMTHPVQATASVLPTSSVNLGPAGQQQSMAQQELPKASLDSLEEDEEEQEEEVGEATAEEAEEAEDAEAEEEWDVEIDDASEFTSRHGGAKAGVCWLESEWTEEDEERWHQEPNRDYYAALGLPPGGGRNFSVSAVRHAYHRVACKLFAVLHGHHGGKGFRRAAETEPAARRQAELKFWLVTEAYLVLKDPERRRIYDENGLAALRKSEECYEQSVFDQDASEVFESFFRGDDPEDRDFLLMNGQPGDDTSESDDEGEEALRAALQRFAGLDSTGTGGAGGTQSAQDSPATSSRQRAVEPQLPAELTEALNAMSPCADAVEAVGLDSKWTELINATLASVPPPTGHTICGDGEKVAEGNRVALCATAGISGIAEASENSQQRERQLAVSGSTRSWLQNVTAVSSRLCCRRKAESGPVPEKRRRLSVTASEREVAP